MKQTRKPGDLLKMFREGGTKRKAAMKAAGVKHSGSSQHKKKVAAPEKQNLGLALKKSVRSKPATHIHVHIHSDMPQGVKQERMEEDKHEFKRAHKMKRKSSGKKFEDPKGQGEKLEHEEEGKKEFKRKSAHKCKGSACKHSSHKRKSSIKRKGFGSMENGGMAMGKAVGSAMKTVAARPQVNVSAPTPWTNTTTGKSLKRSGKRKKKVARA